MTVRFSDAVYEEICAKAKAKKKSLADVVESYVLAGMQNKNVSRTLEDILGSLDYALNDINKSLAIIQNKIKFNTDVTCYVFSNMARKVNTLLIKPNDDKDFQKFKDQRKSDKFVD